MLTAGDRTATYGEFAEAAAKVKLDKEPEIKKDPATWWLLGKPKQRLDIPHKVNAARNTRSIPAFPAWSMPRSRRARCRGER